MLQSEMEKFNSAFDKISDDKYKAPMYMTESKEVNVKKMPLTESRLHITELNKKQKEKKTSTAEALNEAISKVTELYQAYVAEGVLEEAKRLNPSNAAGIEAFQDSLCEAASKAKGLL